ncbi:hypothetical protein LWI28_018230 [Acer negundo]|uniref:Uncharacterized protein n=1 Tax=Acer negundo TaxID=4023 RepID=A0AAD5JU80_ACENE|nr:hypothetical protein LWI28_018230 [Acer negundo]
MCKRSKRRRGSERDWFHRDELICSRHWATFSRGYQQLRSVVLALGGFHRLQLLYLWKSSLLTPINAVVSLTTGAVSALYGFVLPLVELTYKKANQEVHTCNGYSDCNVSVCYHFLTSSWGYILCLIFAIGKAPED